MVGGIRGKINRRLHIYWTFLLQHLMRACSLVIECNVSTNFFKELHFGVGTGRSDDFEAFVFGELNNQAEIENGRYVKWSHHSDSLGTTYDPTGPVVMCIWYQICWALSERRFLPAADETNTTSP